MLTKIVIVARSIEEAEKTLSVMKKAHPEIRCAEIRIEEKSAATNDAITLDSNKINALVDLRIIKAV